jgi:hypothetical protein
MEIDVEGPGTFAVEVVGASQYQDVLERAGEAGAIVCATLIFEDSNPYDDQAVAVHVNGRRTGYLSRANARLYRADLVAAGDSRLTARCTARIVGGFDTARGERAHFGLKLDLPKLST